METRILELRLLKAAEVAQILNVSKAHVYNLMATGQLPSVHIGVAKRIRPEDLGNFINSRMQFSDWE